MSEKFTDEQVLAEWLEREMPPGTVISDPRWWAKRIAARAYAATLQAKPEWPSDDIRKVMALVDHVVHGECGAETLTEVYDLLTAALPTTKGDAT